MNDGTTRRVPWLAWVFVALAVAETVRVIGDSDVGSNATLQFFVAVALGLVPAIASILLPAALLFAHPNAWRVAPTLLFGTILVALVQGLQVLGDPLQSIFEILTPASEELPDFVPMAAAYNVLTFVVLVFGLAYIAVGLSRARRSQDSPADVTSLFVPLATILATVAGVIEVSRLDIPLGSLTPALVFYVAAAFVPGILQMGVWAYLLAITTRGWRAGDAPAVGWRLGVLGPALVLGSFLLIYVVRILELQASLGDPYLYIVSGAYALGYLSLLFAFFAGLPEIAEDGDQVGDEDDEVDHEADGEAGDEARDSLDEGGWPIAT
jgi:hypothetical protein